MEKIGDSGSISHASVDKIHPLIPVQTISLEAVFFSDLTVDCAYDRGCNAVNVGLGSARISFVFRHHGKNCIGLRERGIRRGFFRGRGGGGISWRVAVTAMAARVSRGSR